MTRKHFARVAQAMKKLQPASYVNASDDNNENQRAEVWEDVCRTLAATFASINPRFQSTVFLSECGIPESDL
jgi:hypothetical protein